MAKNWTPEAAAAAVRYLYKHILERDVDDSGLVTYSCALDRGEKSVRDIVRIMGSSNEYEARLVRPYPPRHVARKMYRHFLARDAESQKVVDETARRITEHGWKAAAAAFIESTEYAQRFGDDSVPA